jgi:nicotinamide riboside transporter PnuC
MAMMDPASWMFVLVVSVVCSIACTILSFKKGYRGSAVFGWLAMGLFFSVFALIAIILAPYHHEA